MWGEMKNEPVYIVSAEETYQYGQIIYEEGNSGDWVYVVLSGLVEVSKMVEDKKTIIEILQSGDVFGVMEYIGRSKRATTVRSIGTTTLGLIDREFLDREYNQLSVQLRNLLQTMAHRSTKILESFPDLASRSRPAGQKVLPLVFSDGKNSFRAFSTNINAKGLFVVTENLLREGQEFPMKLQLPGVSDLLQIMCVVVSITGGDRGQKSGQSGMVVKFTKISKKDYTSLRAFLCAEGEV